MLTDLQGVSIENSVKYLGVTIDENLNFEDHVQRVKKKLLFSRRFMKWNATIIVTLFFLSTRTDQNSS